MTRWLRDYVRVASHYSKTQYGYGCLGILAAEIVLKDVLGLSDIDGKAAHALLLGNGLLGVSSCISLISAGFGVPTLRAYRYAQRVLQVPFEVDGDFWGGYARADTCRRKGLDLALDEAFHITKPHL